MHKKTRYLLLLLGLLVFVIIAPVIVLYVRGITFNFSTKTFVATGILAIKSNPSNVDIFLNGELSRHGEGDINFMAPGEYQVDLKKPGYQDWSKRLAITPGQVTWASPGFNKIYLFFSEPKIQNLQNEVLDFYSRDEKIIYLSSDRIFAGKLNNLQDHQSYPLPKKVNKIFINDTAGKNFVLAQTDNSTSTKAILVFNLSNGQVHDITGLFTALPKMQFGSDDGLYALNENTLYKIDWQNKTKTALFQQVKAFYFHEDSLYFIQKTPSQTQNYSLLLSQTPFKDGQTLLNNLPAIEPTDLLVTFEKQILLFSGGSLYLTSSEMQKLAENIDSWDFNQKKTSLAIVHAGQLDYYDPSSNNLHFVTRESVAVTNPVINSGVAGAFFAKNNKLMEIELDTRDNQNQHILYSGENIQKFSVDDAGQNILMLDNGNLKNLIIR